MPRPHEVKTLEGLAALDSDQITAGYRAGLRESPDFARAADPGYLHGYLNGLADRHPTSISPAQRELARVFVAASNEVRH